MENAAAAASSFHAGITVPMASLADGRLITPIQCPEAEQIKRRTSGLCVSTVTGKRPIKRGMSSNSAALPQSQAVEANEVEVLEFQRTGRLRWCKPAQAPEQTWRKVLR